MKETLHFLRDREFIAVGTCNLQGKPNSAPKLILKHEGHTICLIDYSIGRTWQNLKINPKASLSFMNMDNLTGYQLNGMVEIIDQGPIYENALTELKEREIRLSVERIIQGVHREKGHDRYEVEIPKKVIVLKVTVDEIVEIHSTGELRRRRLSEA